MTRRLASTITILILLLSFPQGAWADVDSLKLSLTVRVLTYESDEYLDDEFLDATNVKVYVGDEVLMDEALTSNPYTFEGSTRISEQGQIDKVTIRKVTGNFLGIKWSTCIFQTPALR